MPEFDVFSGAPIQSEREERFWTQHPARAWHNEAAAKADAITWLEQNIAAATDPYAKHALQCQLASKLGLPQPVFQEPPPAETAPPPAKPKSDWREEIAESRATKGRKRDRVRRENIAKQLRPTHARNH
jgi:hypothetical protein